MKKILVPMDFTEASANALEYARQLYSGAQLVIVHVAPILTNLGTQPSKSSPETNESLLISSLKSYVQNTLQWKKWPGNIHVAILQGSPVKEINAFVSDNNFDFAVMGTRDKHSLVDRWIGTISLGLVKKLKIPVYLIPRFSSFETFDRIVVASDSFQLHKDLILMIREWNEDHNAFIKFVHIQEDVNDAFNEECLSLVESIFGEGEPGYGFEIVNVGNRQVCRTLLATAYNFKADLLITLAKHQSFLESMMVLNVTKELIEQARLPVLFFHTD